jgi:hypothetical protein
MGAFSEWPVFPSLVILRAHTCFNLAVTHVVTAMGQLCGWEHQVRVGKKANRGGVSRHFKAEA